MTLNTLWDRVKNRDTRPLLQTDNPKQTLTDIYQARVPIYAKAGLRTVVIDDASIEQTSDSVLQTLVDAPNILDFSS